MFQKPNDPKDSFLQQTKAAREERALEKKKDVAATIIQANIRRWLARRKFVRDILYVFILYLFNLCFIKISD